MLLLLLSSFLPLQYNVNDDDGDDDDDDDDDGERCFSNDVRLRLGR